MHNEEGWVDIEGFYPYQVHPQGHIRSRRTFRVLRSTVVSQRYLTVTLRKDGVNYIVYLHKIINETFLPRPVGEYRLHHKNGNRLDCSVANMEWRPK